MAGDGHSDQGGGRQPSRRDLASTELSRQKAPMLLCGGLPALRPGPWANFQREGSTRERVACRSRKTSRDRCALGRWSCHSPAVEDADSGLGLSGSCPPLAQRHAELARGAGSVAPAGDSRASRPRARACRGPSTRRARARKRAVQRLRASPALLNLVPCRGALSEPSEHPRSPPVGVVAFHEALGPPPWPWFTSRDPRPLGR